MPYRAVHTFVYVPYPQTECSYIDSIDTDDTTPLRHICTTQCHVGNHLEIHPRRTLIGIANGRLDIDGIVANAVGDAGLARPFGVFFGGRVGVGEDEEADEEWGVGSLLFEFNSISSGG